MFNDQVTQSQIIDEVISGLTKTQANDLPAIRTSLNDTMDHYHKAHKLTTARSDKWSQDRMVKAVQKGLR